MCQMIYMDWVSDLSVEQTRMDVGGAQQMAVEAPPPPLSGMEAWLCQRLKSIHHLHQTIISEVTQAWEEAVCMGAQEATNSSRD